MLENLTDEIRVCLRHAEDCARKAAEASRPNARENFLEMQRRWLRLAHRYQFAKQLKGFRTPSIWISVRATGMPVAATLDVCPTCKCMKSSVSTFDRLLPGLRNMPTSPSGRRWQRLAHLSINSLSCACERERQTKQPSCSARMRHDGSPAISPSCRSALKNYCGKPQLYQGLVQYAKVKAFCSALAARSNTSSGISDVRTCSSNSSKSAITCPFSALYVTKYCDSTSARCDLRHSTKRATPSRASRRPGPSRFVPQAANVSR